MKVAPAGTTFKAVIKLSLNSELTAPCIILMPEFQIFKRPDLFIYLF